MRGKGWRLCVNQNQDEIKLLPPSPSFKMSNQTVCKRGIIRYTNKTSYKVQNTSKCIKDLSGKFSTCTISRKSLIRRSRPLIHFFLHDNPSEFTCSQKLRAICAICALQVKIFLICAICALQVCFFRQKLSDIAHWQRKSDVFTPNKQRWQKSGAGGSWGL